MIDCPKCKKAECLYRGATWMPASSRFCNHFVLFLLNNYCYLNLGKYPPAPEGQTRGRSGKVPGSTPKEAILVKTRLDERLKMCGKDGEDGKILLLNLLLELPLCDRSLSALEYITGKWPKKQSYTKWKSGRR
jgi:hypothetical protein